MGRQVRSRHTRVDQIIQQRQEHQHQPRGEERRRNNAHDPVHLGPVGPREPEQAHGQQHGADQGGGQPGLGGREAVVRVGDPPVPPVIVAAVGDGAQHADGDAEEGQAADPRRPAPVLLEDDREGGEHHVQRSAGAG